MADTYTLFIRVKNGQTAVVYIPKLFSYIDLPLMDLELLFCALPLCLLLPMPIYVCELFKQSTGQGICLGQFHAFTTIERSTISLLYTHSQTQTHILLCESMNITAYSRRVASIFARATCKGNGKPETTTSTTTTTTTMTMTMRSLLLESRKAYTTKYLVCLSEDCTHSLTHIHTQIPTLISNSVEQSAGRRKKKTTQFSFWENSPNFPGWRCHHFFP